MDEVGLDEKIGRGEGEDEATSTAKIKTGHEPGPTGNYPVLDSKDIFAKRRELSQRNSLSNAAQTRESLKPRARSTE